MTINMHHECAGYYKIEAVKADGSRRILADWFPNLILDSGLDRMGTSSDYLSWCQVGSGSTAPVDTQTALVSRVAGTSTVQNLENSNSGSAPFFARRTTTFRFDQGVATGVLAEVGVGWEEAGSLYSRALILDGLGNPTTITVLADESLDVTYELRMYVWTGETTGSITLKEVSHAVTQKSSNASAWSLTENALSASNTPYAEAFTGQPSAEITGSPDGTNIGFESATAVSYTPGSRSIAVNIFADLSQWLDALGIGSIDFRAGWGSWQIGFVPNIMKTSGDTLTLQVRHTWGRKA